MNIYLIRHGETPWNNEAKFQGTTDIPLNDYGIELAEITSKALEDIDFDICFTSDLIRARQTAEIMCGSRNIEIIPDSRLREMSFGKYEGFYISELSSCEDHPMYNFINRPEIYVAQDGEDFSDVEARAKSFINEVLIPLEGKYKNVLLSSHGAFIRSFLRCVREQDLADYWRLCPQKNCSVNILELSNGKISVIEESKLYYDINNSGKTMLSVL